MKELEEYHKMIRKRLADPYQGEDVHRHHVVPRCMKSARNKTVRLSPKEHAYAHWLLWRISRTSPKLKPYEEYLRAAYYGLMNMKAPKRRSKRRSKRRHTWRR
jgi:hypothetical protein